MIKTQLVLRSNLMRPLHPRHRALRALCVLRLHRQPRVLLQDPRISLGRRFRIYVAIRQHRLPHTSARRVRRRRAFRPLSDNCVVLRIIYYWPRSHYRRRVANRRP